MLTAKHIPLATCLLLASCSNAIHVPEDFGRAGAPEPVAAQPMAAGSPASPTAEPQPTTSSGIPLATAIDGPIWLDEPTSNRATPLSRGTLAVTADETTAIAADPDRDAIFVVNLLENSVVALETEPEVGLGQVVVGASGVAFVAARRGGYVLRIDSKAPGIDASFGVCASPQGLALDDATNQLHVACRDGSLLTLNASTGDIVRNLALDDDLRDVLVREEGLIVSRFRSAEILVLDAAGREVGRMRPTTEGAGVAWRTLLSDDGRVVVAHQMNSVVPLPGTTYYGNPCGASLSQPTVTLLDPDLLAVDGVVEPQLGYRTPEFVEQQFLRGAAGAVDVALDPITGNVVAVVPGNALAVEPLEALMEVNVVDPEPATSTTCPNGDDLEYPLPEVPVSVAVGAGGTRYVLTREPAELVVIDDRAIPLSDVSRQDTGLRMFHMNTGLNVACASCHPEGREDGYTWKFQEIGERRTQSLEGGVSGLAPFHWEGDLPTLADFVAEVLARRMGLSVVPDERELAALRSFIDRIPLPAQRTIEDPAAVDRGRVLFHDPSVGCASCHSGELLTDNALYDVGTGELLVTPPLVRVSERAPFMHDGCAATLLDRFSDCGGADQHGTTSQLRPEQLLDLVAFLESL